MIALSRAMTPPYRNRRISIEVSRASQTHQVPQVGLPQTAPVNRERKVSTSPTGATDLTNTSASFMRQTRPTTPAGMPDAANPTDGRTVVLSVDDAGASQALALDLARRASGAGDTVLFLEVFPEVDDPRAAPGFSDLVAGVTAFSKVIYRDPESGVHIIEAGRLPIDDRSARSPRFGKALEAVFRTYDMVVVNLGTIDGSLASARLLGLADKILVTSAGRDYGRELDSAASLLARNTGAPVEVIQPADSKAPRKRSRRGAGRAA